jgi:hypothetical protein
LGESLIRLHQHLQENNREDAQVESLFDSWQRRWSSRRDQITSRLKMIETALERLAGAPAPSPRFSVINTPCEPDDLTAESASQGREGVCRAKARAVGTSVACFKFSES